MSAKPTNLMSRRRRQLRARHRIVGTPERPRLCVTKTLNHMYAQVIDDSVGNTLAAAGTREAAIAADLSGTGNVVAAKAVGLELGKRALAKGITKVVFDRAGWPYHGRVQAVAEGAREAGLEF